MFTPFFSFSLSSFALPESNSMSAKAGFGDPIIASLSAASLVGIHGGLTMPYLFMPVRQSYGQIDMLAHPARPAARPAHPNPIASFRLHEVSLIL